MILWIIIIIEEFICLMVNFLVQQVEDVRDLLGGDFISRMILNIEELTS